MRKFLMGLIAALIAIALPLGVMSTATAATGSSGGTTQLEVSTWSVGAASSSAAIHNETRLVIDGATQVSWEVPDHNVTVTKKQLKKAVHIKVNALGANSSKVIFKTAVKKLMKSKNMTRKQAVKAAGIVVLKKGSWVRNTGKENKLRVGFPWRLAYDAVLVFDKPSKQYRHAYNIRDGKLIKTCLNYIGGDVPMREKVVQVRYEEDIQYGGDIAAVAEAKVSVKFALTCPNGASFEVDGWAMATGRANDRVTYTSRTRVAVEDSFKLKAEHNILINQDVFAKAGAGINVKATCGDVPPPPPVTFEPPAASGNAKACVNPGEQNGVITASGTNPNNVSAPGTLTVGGKTQQFASVGAGQTVTADFSGFAPGTYNGSFTLGAPINKSVTFAVTVDACQVSPPTIDTVVKVNDVIEYASRTIRITGTVPAGREAILLSTACNGGTITGNQRVEVSGSFTVDVGYTAGEVPGENTDQGCEVQAGYERLNVKLTDTVDQTLKDSTFTTFRIIKRPVTP